MKFTRFAVVLMLLGGAAACSDDTTGVTLPKIGDFVGNWVATQAVITSDTNADSTLDLTLGGIATVSLSIAADSTYEFAQDVLALSVTGTFLITGANTFDLTNDDTPTDTLSGTFALTSSNTKLSIVLPGTTLHPDPASILNPGTLAASFDKQ